MQTITQRIIPGMVLVLNLALTAAAAAPKKEGMPMKNEWVRANLTDAEAKPPFSFVFDGKASEALLTEWPKKVETKTLDANRTEHTLRWTEPKSGLEVRCVAVDYADYPAIEWTVYFRNLSTNDTPVLENIQGLDARFARGNGGEIMLHGIKGDFDSKDSYQPYDLPLGPNTSSRFAPDGGRPSNGQFPYYNLQMPGGGILLAIGWPGQWASSFTRDATNGLRIVAGQELTRLLLKPGEHIRAPLIAMLFWQGDDTVPAQNLWRRWYVEHNMPRINGKTPQPMAFITMEGVEEDKKIVQSYLDAGIRLDLFWRDAVSGGPVWFAPGGNRWQEKTGTWEVDTNRYPNGFKPFSDWLRARGIKFLLWFEPERVGDPNSWLGKNHPEWLLGRQLLNLGDPAALRWLTDHVDRIVTEQGIGLYRQDFNIAPLDFWRNNDAPDRRGITENKHVMGYLAYWDELRRRHPDVPIDSCASGGRRNDLETMRRALPLLRSDLIEPNKPGVVEGNQGHTHALSSWLPFHGSAVYSPEPYVCRSYYLPCFGHIGEYAVEKWRKAYAECRKIAPMVLEGDYYPLTPYSLTRNQWIAWQFNRPAEGDGVVQAFRRPDCVEVSQTYRLRGLDPEAMYEVTNFDVEGSTKVRGADLMQKGLTVEIKDKPGAAVITLTKCDLRAGDKGYGPGLVQLTAGTWQHVAIVCDGERAFCYINGEEKSAGS